VEKGGRNIKIDSRKIKQGMKGVESGSMWLRTAYLYRLCERGVDICELQRWETSAPTSLISG